MITWLVYIQKTYQSYLSQIKLSDDKLAIFYLVEESRLRKKAISPHVKANFLQQSFNYLINTQAFLLIQAVIHTLKKVALVKNLDVEKINVHHTYFEVPVSLWVLQDCLQMRAICINAQWVAVLNLINRNDLVALMRGDERKVALLALALEKRPVSKKRLNSFYGLMNLLLQEKKDLQADLNTSCSLLSKQCLTASQMG